MEATATLPEAPAKKSVSLEELYENTFPVVAGAVRKLGGDFNDAKDIFHDALVIYQEKLADPEFTLPLSPAAYLTGIAKHLWLRKYKHRSNQISLSALEQEITIPDDYFPEVNTLRLVQLLEQTGHRCLKLLRAFYYEQFSVQAIVAEFGFSTKHSATVQKYKCLEKIRNTVKEKTVTYEDFLN